MEELGPLLQAEPAEPDEAQLGRIRETEETMGLSLVAVRASSAAWESATASAPDELAASAHAGGRRQGLHRPGAHGAGPGDWLQRAALGPGRRARPLLVARR